MALKICLFVVTFVAAVFGVVKRRFTWKTAVLLFLLVSALALQILDGVGERREKENEAKQKMQEQLDRAAELAAARDFAQEDREDRKRFQGYVVDQLSLLIAATTPPQSPAEQKETQQVQAEIKRAASSDPLHNALQGYLIQVFYAPKDQAEATQLESKLRKRLPGIKVETKLQQDTAHDDQIRYTRGTETKGAVALQGVLAELAPTHPFRMQTVTTPTEGSLSVFLKTR